MSRMGAEISRVLVHADETMKRCGIEVFRVGNGRLAECGNTPYAEGHRG